MIKQTDTYNVDECAVYIISDKKQIDDLLLTEAEMAYVKKIVDIKSGFVHINSFDKSSFVILLDVENTKDYQMEQLRVKGTRISDKLNKSKYEVINILDLTNNGMSLALAEGIELSNYRFEKYLANKSEVTLKDIKIVGTNDNNSEIEKLNSLVKGVYYARDIVNEPLSYMTAKKLSEEIEIIGKNCGFKTEVLDKKQIESLKMGGLLAVNRGSVEPPTFNILQWEPQNAVNEKPIVLVGKGLVFDTGGQNLKSSASMETMKCDKAGGAAVVGTIAALAMAKIPVKVYGLIPATENRIGNNSYVPEDIITMFDGTTVEVANTDAEGRLILADALSYAKKYDPELVVDIATLTGAAVVAIGDANTAIMGNAATHIEKFKTYGFKVWERLVELPLWDDFKDQLKSPIADMKNCGSRAGGAITAGKFLEHFTDYKWIHLDIAGPAFTEKKDSYRGNGATAVPTRLLFNYISDLA